MANTSSRDDLDKVIFQGSHQLERSELERHGLSDLGGRRFGRKLEDLKGDWERVSHQITEWIEAARVRPPDDFDLDEVSVELGFNAKGQLVFVAEGGVQATVKLTLKRRDRD